MQRNRRGVYSSQGLDIASVCLFFLKFSDSFSLNFLLLIFLQLYGK